MKPEVFKQLFDRYFDDVRRFIFYKSGDTEMSTDVAQEVFMKIWEKKLMPDPGKEIALLFKMASNIFISRIRRDVTARNYRQAMVLDEASENATDQLEYEEMKERYEQALIRLTEKQREVFLMSRIDELTYPEIAERLGVGIKAVEKRMSQALSLLREALL